MRNYIICTVQRSGKTWLCTILRSLEPFGCPEEYVNILHKNLDLVVAGRSLQEDFRSDGIRGLVAFLRHRTDEYLGRPGPIGLVLQWNQLPFLSRRLGMGNHDVFRHLVEELNPTIFFLRRKDVLQQAISHYISHTSGVAHSNQNDVPVSGREAVPFDPDGIIKFYNFTISCYARWVELFAHIGIRPVEVLYEDLCDDINGSIRRVAATLQCKDHLTDERICDAATKMTKISDELDWQFRTEFERLIADSNGRLRSARQ